MTAVRTGAQRRRPRVVRPRRPPAPRRRLPSLWPPVGRRVVLACVLLAVLLFPVAGLVSAGPPQPASCRGCGADLPAVGQRWAVPLPGAWLAGSGGTAPATGQADVAVGGGIAVVGEGLTLTAFALTDGRQLWQTTLGGPAGGSIMSVRAWPGAVTAGILAADGRARTEAVVAASSGAELRHYPAAVFGGAVAASLATTVVVGRNGVTSYDNKDGHVRWYHATGQNKSWQVDGATLYVAVSDGGYLSSSPVTALQVMNLRSGAERPLSSPLGLPFSGTLAAAADGVALFASASGVTAYSGLTGATLWSKAGSVPEGADPAQGLVYLTSADTTLTGVDPQTGQVKTSVSSSVANGGAELYVVRDGVALGLGSGANGDAWAYDVAAGRVTWTSSSLPWPHYFSDLSGLGGSAAVSSDSDVVVIAACPQLASSSSSSTSSASPGSSANACADPELVAFTL
jgi:outer membrane protein assembly factor BamB